jgi:hypothetical protein
MIGGAAVCATVRRLTRINACIVPLLSHQIIPRGEFGQSARGTLRLH